MTAAEILEQAHAAGIGLAVVDGRLALRGNAPAELRAQIRQHKAELVELLAPVRSARGPCVNCGAPVTWTNGLRNWFGELVHLRCPDLTPMLPGHDGGDEKSGD
jgi:hypothetical protein